LPIGVGHPFSLDHPQAYLSWRSDKLSRYPRRAEDLLVEVRNPLDPSETEVAEIRRICGIANMAVYASPRGGVADKDIPRRLGERLGLTHLHANLLSDEDGISSLQATPAKSAAGYVPYSNQRLLWHTDGYYNGPNECIRAFSLHCVRPARAGGESRLLDPEIAYILLRDANPDYIRALVAPDAMTIPANVANGIEIRAARSGPVFSVDRGKLHMRFTARTRSIEWRPDGLTRDAVAFLKRILEADSPYVFTHRLEAGQGLVCNNVLHNRSAFTDDPGPDQSRLVYRARYSDRIE
jgi:alpha-ketoglutarate-dependent taurine dioxygenase